jgi:uncharacterized RDD family membrane protein YckC
MARWTGTWLSGLGAAGVQLHAPGERPGTRLGLPADGPGSVAGFGARAAAFAVDAVLSGLVARLLFPVRDVETPTVSSGLAPVVVLAVVYVLGLALTGQTPGMKLLRLRTVAVGGGLPMGGPAARGAALGLVPAALRTALLLLLVPALISDRDGRGLHDRASGAAVVRA